MTSIRDTTRRPCRVTWLENIGVPQTFDVPAGTKVIRQCGRWAIQSEADMVRLTGNTHDSRYRWAFVPDEAMQETSP